MYSSLASSLRCVGSLLASALFVSAANAGGVLDFLLPSYELQAITVTDLTPTGKQRPHPTPSQPIYYAAVSAGFRDFGGIKAGEKTMAREKVNEIVMKALAKQGYLPAAPNQQPDIYLAWSWGTLNAEYAPFGVDGRSIVVNQHQLLMFLGGDRLGLASKSGNPFPEFSLAPGLFSLGGEAEYISSLSKEDLYVAVVAAYEISGEGAAAKPAMLWQTRISSPSRGFYLPDAFPAMLAIGGDFFGRDTPKPVWIHATDKFKPDIKLGDPRFMEYIENGKGSVSQVGSSR